MGEPNGQENASANSGMLDNPALTLTREGACWSVRTLRRCDFSPVLEHHTCNQSQKLNIKKPSRIKMVSKERVCYLSKRLKEKLRRLLVNRPTMSA
jgi:hypothetical protein